MEDNLNIKDLERVFKKLMRYQKVPDNAQPNKDTPIDPPPLEELTQSIVSSVENGAPAEFETLAFSKKNDSREQKHSASQPLLCYLSTEKERFESWKN